MSSNLTIEAPDFDLIKKLDGTAIKDAIQLLWYVANNEASDRRTGIRTAQETERRKVKSDAPTAQRDSYDTEGATFVQFTGSTAFHVTGVRNGQTGDCRVFHNLGTGTVTFDYESASSAATERFDMQSAANVAVATGKTFVVRYLNSRWRQQVQA